MHDKTIWSKPSKKILKYNHKIIYMKSSRRRNCNYEHESEPLTLFVVRTVKCIVIEMLFVQAPCFLSEKYDDKFRPKAGKSKL